MQESWAPLFSKIVDSSIWDEPDWVCKIWITMMARKGKDHVYCGSAYNLARQSRKTEEEVLKALEILSSPDTKRLEPQPYEGRRIEKVEKGWLVLNGQYYEDEMRKMNRRAYQSEKQAEYREEEKQMAINSEPGYTPAQQRRIDRLRAKIAREEALEEMIKKQRDPNYVPKPDSQKVKLPDGVTIREYIKSKVESDSLTIADKAAVSAKEGA